MQLRRFWPFVALAFGVVLFSGTSRSAEYPWVDPANTQVIILRDAQVDFATRIAAIERARYSVDSITYNQAVDDRIGMPVLKAFRRAQERGVKGRYLFSRLTALMTDRKGVARAMLADSDLKQPGEVIAFGGIKNWFRGLRATDIVHEKILIIDAGTPNEMIWIGGRNNDANAVSDIDTGFLIRRIDPSKPYVGDQIKAAFEETWQAAAKISEPLKPKRLDPKVRAAIDALNGEVALASQAQRLEADRLRELIARPADAAAPLLDAEVRPGRMRVLTNDLFNYLLTGIFGRSSKSRRLLTSDIADAAAPIVARSKVLYLNIMSVFMPEPLKEAVRTAIRNGAEVRLITNSRATHKTQVPLGVAYEFGLKEVLELMHLAEEAGGKLSVYVLSEKLLKANPELYPLKSYLHRKMIIADDNVFAGSDNFNDGSRKSNSEIVVHTEDAEFARKMRAILHDDLQVFERLGCEQALTDRKTFNIFKRGLNRIFFPLY